MNRDLQIKLNQHVKTHKAKRKWVAIVASLCAVVAVGTSYLLINPADTQVGKTYCGYEEHVEHNEDCYRETRALICPLSEEGHTHSESCYEENRVLTCSLFETDGHAHSDACYSSEEYLSCGIAETDGHQHGEDCYGTEEYLSCGSEETDGHQHGEDCYGTEEYLSCGSEETDGHQHGEDCYETERVLICNDSNEEHIHTDECYEEKEILTCQLEEREPHRHDEACYSTRQVLICNEEAAAPHHHDETCYSTRRVLICNEEAAAPHHHDDSCYETQTVCTCGMEECDPHQHSEECYEIHLLCELPIHVHTLQCFSNPEADVETAFVWERTFDRVELTGNWNEDVLAIAQTQLGYTESTANYEVQEDGTTMKGYTRYGDWYGNAYGDWCAMFCSFCMHYAGVERDIIPFEASCQRWIETLSDPEFELYYPAHNEKYLEETENEAELADEQAEETEPEAEEEEETYIPVPGDLIFFDWDKFDPEHPEDRKADHVGLVAELIHDETTDEVVEIKTIEGNSGDCVRYKTYDFKDTDILGYGELPDNPEYGACTIESQPASDGAVAVITGILPDGAEAVIESVTLSEEELAAYVGEEQAALMKSYAVYDIKIMVDGEEWQPDHTVSVVIKQTELTAEENESFAVAHVDDETSDVSKLKGEISDDGEISFNTDGFSLYIFYTYTVDFHYGDLSFSINGAGSILLSELFDELGITESVEDVQEVSFSDESLLSVEETGDGDWLLTSLGAFSTDELLTVTFANGDILQIHVTDAQGSGYTRPAPPSGVVETGANDWQIVAEGFSGNELDDKVAYNGGSTEPEVYVQKNVVPTDNENEFLVYLSLSRPASMEDWIRNSSFATLPNKNPDFDLKSGSPKDGQMYKPEDVPAGTAGLNLKYITVNIYDTLTYDNQGGVTSYGTLLSTFGIQRYTAVSSCSNGSIYILIPELNSYIKIIRGVNFHDDEGGQGKPFVLNISMEKIASTIGVAIQNTIFDTVTDVLGDNMEFVTDAGGSPVVYCDGEVTIDSDGVTLYWEPAENPNTEKVYPTTNPLNCILNNNAQLVYKVRLKTETEGFASCADSSTGSGLSPLPTQAQARSAGFDPSDYNAYGTNDHATLTYHIEPMSGGSGTPSASRSTDFPIPYVRGLLYDLRFQKVSDSGVGLPDAVFRMLDANRQPIKDEGGNVITFTSDEDGYVDILGRTVLPTYVEEITPPAGYQLPTNPVFGPLKENWTKAGTTTARRSNYFTQETLNGYTDNMRSKEKDSGTTLWQISNTPLPGKTIVLKKIDSETANPVKGVTFAIYGTDGSGNMNAEPHSGCGELTSDLNGVFSPDGFTLPYGTYYLVETAARAGYQELTAPIKIEVKNQSTNAVTVLGTDGSPSVSFENGVYTITVQNERLPGTDPLPPGEPEYVPDEPADVTLKKQIDYLGDNGIAGMDELYRLYLSLETEIEPMDLLLVIDQSTSMAEDMYGHDAGTAEFIGESRQYYVNEFLNGTGSDGFIARFLDANEDNRLAVLTFGSDCSYSNSRYIHSWDSDDRSVNLDPSPVGATNYAAALSVANGILEESREDFPNKRRVMIFLSDGVPTLAYADGGMHCSFDYEMVGTGNHSSDGSVVGLAGTYVLLHSYNQASTWDAVMNFSSPGIVDDLGNQYAYRSRCVEPFSPNISSPALVWPVVYDLTTIGLDIPGTNFPQSGVTDQEAFNAFKTMWNGFTDEQKLAWIEENTVYPGDAYDIFYLTESAFAEFSVDNTDVPVFSVFFSALDDEDLPSGRNANEVLKYMSGDEHSEAPSDRYQHYQPCGSAEELAAVINSIVGLSDVSITDPLSGYVDFVTDPKHADWTAEKVCRLEIKLTNEAYSDHDNYPYLYQNGSFTELGTMLLDTNATKIDTVNRTVKVVFKPKYVYVGEFNCEVSFDVIVNENAYETYAEDGYNATGDLDTDYLGDPNDPDDDNDTSSDEYGFYSNDGAAAEWTYYGHKDDEYDDPVVQIRAIDVYLRKFDADDLNTSLAGAEFDLYREYDEEQTDCITYYDGQDAHYLVKVNSEPIVSVTDDDGYVTMEHLYAGKYWLFETKAPDGYINLKAPVFFEIKDNLNLREVLNADCDPDAMSIDVPNNRGYKLPETGGPGTALYTLGGMVLMTGAMMYGCMMRRRRERRSE